ncbi:MAG: RDD family protein [Bacillota bacterium]|nr:RDD family protein [Bacillota bacterium]
MQSEENAVPQIRPWVRYWARFLDGIAANFIILGIWALTFPNSFINLVIKYGIYMPVVMYIVWAFIEALLLSTWGTTPGKWLLKVMVRDQNGNKLTFDKSLYRSLSVWALGEGCWFYLAYMFVPMFSYARLVSRGKTYWDDKGGFTVTHQKIGSLRSTIAAVILIGVFVLTTLEYSSIKS